MSMQYEQLFEKIRPAIDSKIAEFQHYQYTAITAEELWRYCIEKNGVKRKLINCVYMKSFLPFFRYHHLISSHLIK